MASIPIVTTCCICLQSITQQEINSDSIVDNKVYDSDGLSYIELAHTKCKPEWR